MSKPQEAGAAVSPRNTSRGKGLLLASAAVSITGDGALIAAAPLMAADLTRDSVQIGLVAASAYAAVAIFGLPAGALVDRWNRRTTMIIADAARAVALLAFSVMVVTETATVAALALTVFVVGIGACFFDPGLQAAIPDVVGKDKEQLTRLNSRLWAIDTFGRSLAGPPLGAAAFAWRSFIPFLGDAISFLLSAALVSRLPRNEQAKVRHEPLRRAVWQGIVFLASHRHLRSLAIGQMSYNLPFNISFAMLVLFAQDRLGLGSVGFGLLLAAGAVGGVAAGGIAPRIVKRASIYGTYAVALAVQAAVWSTIVAVPNIWLSGAVLAVLGATSTVVTVVGATARQLMTPTELLGRVVAVTRLLGWGSAAVGAVIGGVLAQIAGLNAPFMVAVTLLVVGSAGFLWSSTRSR